MRERILLIDDDIAVLRTLEIVLSDRGYDILTAKDGVEGLRVFRSARPDLVITDLIMPEKEGIETIVEMRRERPEAKIIAISGGGRTHNIGFLDIAATLGASAVLAKPFTPDQLAQKIDEVTR
ncbi:MAG TPA: response regulator [Stellaceae bacterium]|nr:response regulator [Stellaceae bacterium]